MGPLPECFETIEQIEKYREVLTKIAERRVGSREDAEDIVQQVFIEAWRWMDGLQCAILRSLLLTILIRRVVDALRRRGHEARGLEDFAREFGIEVEDCLSTMGGWS